MTPCSGAVSSRWRAIIAQLEGNDRVRVIWIDLAPVYRAVVRKHFPKARIVADRFHVIRLVNPHFLACWREIDGIGSRNGRRRADSGRLTGLGLKAVGPRMEGLWSRPPRRTELRRVPRLVAHLRSGSATQPLSARSLQLARLPFLKNFDQFDFGFQPSIDERQSRELGSVPRDRS